MIGDTELKIAKLYGCSRRASPGTSTADRGRQPDGPHRLRDRSRQEDQAILAYPMTTGRNFDEVLRVFDSLHLTANYKVATPVNWKPGEKVIIAGSVSEDEAKATYPDGWETPKPYIRIVPQPS